LWHFVIKKALDIQGLWVVEPMGETENFDPEDLDKIFEFMGMIEAYAEF
jgi:hypothetical protein